jgi:hypothetical protein
MRVAWVSVRLKGGITEPVVSFTMVGEDTSAKIAPGSPLDIGTAMGLTGLIASSIVSLD